MTCPAFPLSHGVIGAELGGGLVGIKYYSQTYTFNTCAPNQVITTAPTDPDEIKAACGEEGEGRRVSVCGLGQREEVYLALTRSTREQ